MMDKRQPRAYNCWYGLARTIAQWRRSAACAKDYLKRREDKTMIFRLEELFCRTGGLARGEVLRWVGGFAGSRHDSRHQEVGVCDGREGKSVI